MVRQIDHFIAGGFAARGKAVTRYRPDGEAGDGALAIPAMG